MPTSRSFPKCFFLGYLYPTLHRKICAMIWHDTSLLQLFHKEFEWYALESSSGCIFRPHEETMSSTTWHTIRLQVQMTDLTEMKPMMHSLPQKNTKTKRKRLVVASIIIQISRAQTCPPEIDDWRSPAMRSAATWPRRFVLLKSWLRCDANVMKINLLTPLAPLL